MWYVLVLGFPSMHFGMCSSTSTVCAFLYLLQSAVEGQTVPVSLIQRSMVWNTCGFKVYTEYNSPVQPYSCCTIALLRITCISTYSRNVYCPFLAQTYKATMTLKAQHLSVHPVHWK
jgi:hypothetical protein